MALKLDTGKLKELMSDFYILTNIRIVIFDDAYHEILAYPESLCPLCHIMKSHDTTRAKCQKSDVDSFEACKNTGKLVIYHCHAGLIEATAPLKDKGVIIGYIMFGQIADTKNKKDLAAAINKRYQTSSIPAAAWQAAIRKVEYKSLAEIKAAAKILEACTYYVLLNELVSVRHDQLIHRLNQYIAGHLQTAITAQTICEDLHISRTRLYELTRQYLGMGIAGYIKEQRMAKARALLAETDARVSEISEMTGFADYSYFCKVFKKTIGLSPKEYRIELKD